MKAGCLVGADGQWGRVWNGSLQDRERERGFLHAVCIFQWHVDGFVGVFFDTEGKGLSCVF